MKAQKQSQEIAARLARIPLPPIEFQRIVKAEVARARTGALQSFGAEPEIGISVRVGTRWSPTQVVTHRRSTNHTCVGCGCDLDDRTPSCNNCRCRHTMRRAARRKLDNEGGTMIEIGDVVVYIDEDGESRNALVTAVSDGAEDRKPMLNLAVVSKIEIQRDDYGRQISHLTFVPHENDPRGRSAVWRELEYDCA